MHYRSWIEISEKNLLHNLLVFKKLAGKAKVACVVKANAYGHGLREVVGVLTDKADLFAVDSLEEALTVKNSATNKPVLILGYVPTFALRETIENNLSFTIYNFESLRKIVSLSLRKKAKIHLKIETGLNRQGIKLTDLPKFIHAIKKNKNSFEIEGISTHFANIEDTLDPSFADIQLASFEKALKIVRKYGIKPKYVHTAASAATLLYTKTRYNLARVGIGLYGLWPSRETKIAVKTKRMRVGLKPVLSWKSIVAQIKEIKTGESVGYGRTWTASRNFRIAVIPVGYYDGFDRKLSNSGRVVIYGRYAPVIGRVAMNMMTVDVTEIPRVRLEDEVIILGRTGKAEVTAEEMADKLGTINYEVVSQINPNLPRVIKK